MTKRGQGEGSISKRPDGTWWARVTLGKADNGKQKRKAFYGKTRKEVQEKLTAALNDVNKNVYIEPSNMTVCQWINFWLKEYKKPTLRQTTYRIYVKLFELHICPYIGEVKLKNLRNDMIQRAVNELVKRGVSAYTARKAHETFHSALEQAVKNELVAKNAAKGTIFPEVVRKPSRALTPDEQAIVVELAKKYTGGEVFLMSLATGMRIGEVLALTWDDVNWEKGLVHVNKTLSYIKDPDDPEDRWHNLIGPPKTKSSDRKIPLFPAVIELLRNTGARQEADKIKTVTALNNIRVAKGFTQTSVAQKVGIKHGTYQSYEEGVKRPDKPTIMKIADVLGCGIADLLVENCGEYGSIRSQGALRCTLRTEKRKYEPKTKNDRDTVTVLRNKRTLKGFEQKAFAYSVGLVPKTYGSYEDGQTKPSVPVLERIADALACKVDELVVPVKSKYTAGDVQGVFRYELRTETIQYYAGSNLVFCTKTGEAYRAGDMRMRFRDLAAKSGVDNIHIHCLRHTFATRGLESGIELRVMQELLGHSSIKMTSDIYTHVLPDKKKDSVMKLIDVIKF